MEKPKLYICYSINDFCVREAGISMLSFLENNPGYEPEEVFFLDYGIHPYNKERLNEMAGRYGKRIEFLAAKPITDEVKRTFPHLRAWNGTMAPNAKPFMDKIIPPYVERLLFMDADTVVARSVEELLQLDMGGVALAAVPQNWDTDNIRQGKLKLYAGSTTYFNSGVLLYNLAVWRKADCHQMVLDTLQKVKYLFSPDQDLLNHAIPAHLQISLPLKYNYLTHYMHPRQEPKFLKKGHVFTKDEIEEAISRPVIIHYTGGYQNARPWHEGCCSRQASAYLHYKALSPWKDTPLFPAFSQLMGRQKRTVIDRGWQLFWWMLSKQPSLTLSRATAFVVNKMEQLKKNPIRHHF